MMVDKGQGRIALSASSQTIVNLIVALMAVGILRITTHQLGPSDYGLFALVVTYVSLVSLIADLGITAMTTRELSRAGADRSTLFGTAFSSRVALSVLAIPVIIGSAAFLYPDKGSQFHAAIEVMSLDVLFTTVQVTAGTAFSAMVRGHVLAIVTVANRVLYLVGVVFVAVAHGSYLGYICAYVGADFLIAVLLFTMARIEMPFRWSFDVRAWCRTLWTALPLGSIQLIGNVYGWIDSILLSLLRSSAELGFYSVAFNVINVLGAVPSFLMQALIPSLVNASSREVHRLVNRAVYVLVCVGAPLAAGGIVLRNDIVLVLAGDRFLPAATPLAILSATLPVTFVQTAIGFTSVAIDRYRPLLIVGAGTLLFNVAINLILIPIYGPIGAASSLLCSEVISLIATYIVFRHLSAVRIEWRALWRPLLASGFVLGLSAARSILWAHQNRYLALIIGGVLVILVYGLVLLVVGGVPQELRRSKRFRSRAPLPPFKEDGTDG
jgi:O-antigen/teichoic acid export membrane protein